MCLLLTTVLYLLITTNFEDASFVSRYVCTKNIIAKYFSNLRTLDSGA